MRSDDKPTTPEMFPPFVRVLQSFMQYWGASAILAAANLGIADVVEDTPQTIATIAARIGADESCLLRLMRGLVASGVFRESAPGIFVHTETSRALRSDAPGSARAIIRMFGMKSTRQAMAEYESAIRSGKSAFEIVHGTSNPFDLASKNPDELAIYHDGMSRTADLDLAVARSGVFRGVETLVDVGGGRGTLLSQILASNALQRGILFDLPEVVDGQALARQGVAERCEVRAGDLRREVPARADGYILKNILHGWSDEESVALLQRIRGVAAAGARLYIIENVMPEGSAPSPARTFDLFLLLQGSRCRVRSAQEFARLFEAASFRLERITPVQGTQSIVEAKLV